MNKPAPARRPNDYESDVEVNKVPHDLWRMIALWSWGAIVALALIALFAFLYAQSQGRELRDARVTIEQNQERILELQRALMDVDPYNAALKGVKPAPAPTGESAGSGSPATDAPGNTD